MAGILEGILQYIEGIWNFRRRSNFWPPSYFLERTKVWAAPGSTSVFQLPSTAPAQPLATTSKAPSMALASPAAVPQPTFDQPPQCPATSKMTSSLPAYAAPSTRLAPATLPAPLPQPPVLSWQTQCIQEPLPLEQLEEFLSQDVVQNSPPEEQSILAHAVAREMDEVQQADHIHQQTWHKQEVEKRRKTMAQPGWKTEMENQQRALLASQPPFQPPPTTLTGMTSSTTIQENQDPAPAAQARQPDPSSSSSESTWDVWCELQEKNSSYH